MWLSNLSQIVMCFASKYEVICVKSRADLMQIRNLFVAYWNSLRYLWFGDMKKGDSLKSHLFGLTCMSL